MTQEYDLLVKTVSVLAGVQFWLQVTSVEGNGVMRQVKALIREIETAMEFTDRVVMEDPETAGGQHE